MIKLKQYGVAVLLASFLVSGCVSQQSRLEEGQESFNRQDYYQSFQQLKSLAVAGNPDAEYAVAYMYYYGKGVLEDKKLAVEFMEKAAAKNNPLAIEALGIMRANPINK